MDDQLLREFLAEAEDLIEMLVGDLQTLRARRGEGRARRELTARIFRHAHTIKGTASAAGLDVTSQIAHEFETLLDGVRLGRIAVDDAVLDAFEDSTTAISQSLSAVVRGESPPQPTTLLERLRRLALKGEAVGAESDAASAALAALPEEIARSLSEYEEHRLREAAREEGARLYIVTVNFDLATFDERFRDFSDALAGGGELISTLPGLEGAAPDQINFRIVYATEKSFEEVFERVSAFGAVTFSELAVAEAVTDEQAGTLAGEAARETPVDGGITASIAPLTSLVRVELSQLDEMISAAHELMTDTTSALDLSLSCDLLRTERTEMEIRAARIRRRFVELEERLIGMRMIPIAQTLQRAARAGGIAARAMGKEVEFETLGGEVRLDKSLADAISDPLLHLLRNAVDHGIEPVEERKGKDSRGHVRLEAVAEGSRVRVLVTDDGRGIDTARVARAAVERGIVAPDANLTREQSLRLIFRPGFSTALSVSNMSGRGVGLDVVEHAVEQTGGELRVWSEAGAGTTFEMILPTTLALVPSLVVHSAGHRYCVDASHIVEAGLVAAQEVERLGDASVLRWRGQLLPLVHIRELLAQPLDKNPAGERAHVIISHVAGGHRAKESNGEDKPERVAVAVDGWDGHHEVLVRGLGRHAARWRGVGGAAELRGGTVALVLDLPRLLEMAL
jgi:two-component system chemotaxis sensor kinase CheA